jgi:mono/diheme cytochrome c family protein
MRRRRWRGLSSMLPLVTVALLAMWGVAMLRRHTPTPRSLPALRGEAVFLRERCYTCHTINGQGVALKGA